MNDIREEKAVFVGIIRQGDSERKVKEYLDELEFLADTAGAKGDRKFVQKLDKPEKATYIRSGKLQEIAQYCEENEIKYVIFDDELSGMQQRNIEKVIKTSSVIDRTSLILEIFSQRAQTAYAKMQVELARYNYMLPRLAGMWTHLERQRGGIGMRGGMGESQIEIDRRIVRERIARLKEQLAKVDRQMATQRGNRGQLVRLSLVGYTNVGKSTLMNLLAKSDIFAENKLFATLDTTVRKVVIGNVPFLLSDTVGFIRKLPTQLIEAFKSTLDEVREADILIHVVDISHGADTGGGKDARRHISIRQAGISCIQQDRRLYLREIRRVLSRTALGKELHPRRSQELLDKREESAMYLHLSPEETGNRQAARRPLQNGRRNTRWKIPVQQLLVVGASPCTDIAAVLLTV